MAVKATWLFNGLPQSSSTRVWGFSETWYSNNSGQAVINQMDAVTAKRRLILARDTSIVGYRVGQDDGRSFVTRKFSNPPITNDTSNVPVDAALCQVKVAGTGTIKRFFLHDLPDDWIVGDTIDFNRVDEIQAVIDEICFQNFQVRYQNPGATTAQVLSIDSTGIVTTNAPMALNVNDQVQFLAVRDVNNRPIRGKYYVKVASVGNTFTVGAWGGQTVGVRGKVRKVDYRFGAALSLGAQGVIGAASRKVGRPFFQSRGRAPARR